MFVAGRVNHNKKKNGGTKTVKEGKKMRKGFSLIELMFVVAIIVILAAVIIPNFTDITDRSKTARVSEDFSNFATALELYRADWGHFPDVTTPEDITATTSKFYQEMTGTGTLNKKGSTTITGFPGGIQYVKPDTLLNLVSPYDPNDTYYYLSDSAGHAWILYVKNSDGQYVWRSDSTAALQTSGDKPSFSQQP